MVPRHIKPQGAGHGPFMNNLIFELRQLLEVLSRVPRVTILKSANGGLSLFET